VAVPDAHGIAVQARNDETHTSSAKALEVQVDELGRPLRRIDDVAAVAAAIAFEVVAKNAVGLPLTPCPSSALAIHTDIPSS
jgi:hypothetical protein